jgi:Glycosyl transferase family 2
MESEWFDMHRRARRKRYDGWDASTAPTKRAAVITMVHNEGVFFPIWLGYYSRFFGPDDIYVFDHETTDGSTERDGFMRIPVTHDSVDHAWMVETIQTLQNELISSHYEAVLVTDVDEIVAPDPAWGNLRHYIDRIDEDYVNCYGFELIHIREQEPPIDLDRPLLRQRRFWFRNILYDKPALATVPMGWEPGFHWTTDHVTNFDPDLFMIHLHRVDYEICLARHRLRRNRRWRKRDVELAWAAHNLLADTEEFDRWFYEDSGTDECPVVIEPIPEALVGLL